MSDMLAQEVEMVLARGRGYVVHLLDPERIPPQGQPVDPFNAGAFCGPGAPVYDFYGDPAHGTNHTWDPAKATCLRCIKKLERQAQARDALAARVEIALGPRVYPATHYAPKGRARPFTLLCRITWAGPWHDHLRWSPTWEKVTCRKCILSGLKEADRARHR